MLDNPSARTYLKAWERKRAGGNWKTLISDVFCHQNATLLVQAIEGDPECPSVDDRVRKFIDQTGLSRATYFDIKRELRNNDQLKPLAKIEVPHRTLRGSPPCEEEIDEQESDSKPETLGEPGSQRSRRQHGLPAQRKRPQRFEPMEANDESEQGAAKQDADWLHREMQKAIEREDYERAAQLRDEIRRRQGERDLDTD